MGCVALVRDADKADPGVQSSFDFAEINLTWPVHQKKGSVAIAIIG
jgi:hypothetical protein